MSSGEVRLRPVTKDDAAALAEIYKPHVTDSAVSFEFEPPDAAEFERRIASVTAGFPWLVAEREDSSVIGYAYASKFRERKAYEFSCEVTVYVAKKAARLGVATKLYLRLFELLRKLGMHTALAGITLPNPPSERFHESLGFEPVARFREVGRKFDAWHDVGFWQLHL